MNKLNFSNIENAFMLFFVLNQEISLRKMFLLTFFTAYDYDFLQEKLHT